MYGVLVVGVTGCANTLEALSTKPNKAVETMPGLNTFKFRFFCEAFNEFFIYALKQDESRPIVA
jgi:hypothetical protein